MTLGKCLTPCGLETMVIKPIRYLLEILTLNLMLRPYQVEQFGLAG